MAVNTETIKKILKTPVAKIIIAVLALAVVLAGSYGVFIVPHGTVARGVSAGGIKLGGMTKDEALAALSENVKEENVQITVCTASGAERSFSASDTELVRDAEKTVDTVYQIGRDGSFFENMGTLLSLLFSPEDFGYEYSVNEEKLGGILFELGASEIGEMKKYILEFGEGTVTVSKGTAGQSRDVSEEISVFLKEAGTGKTRILIEFKESQPPEPDVDSLFDEIYIAPQNAQYRIDGGRLEFTQEVTGRQIDKIEAGEKMVQLRTGGKITLNLIPLTPEITVEALNAQLFNYTLGEYTTDYSSSSRSRKRNVELAAAKINGIILLPGEEFSYNNIVGPRSAANGFKEASVYSNGETVMGLGGGVCQVSSTLYCAVLYSGLATTERRNHSMTVDYVPKGQDATVSYGTIDYKFKNDTQYPVKVLASANGSKVNVSIRGTKPEVERTIKVINNVVSVKSPTVTETPDPTLPTGNKDVISKGKTGYTVESKRVFYENGIEVKSEKLERSVYRMVPSTVAIGTMVPEAMPTASPAAADGGAEATASPESAPASAEVTEVQPLQTEAPASTSAPAAENSAAPAQTEGE